LIYQRNTPLLSLTHIRQGLWSNGLVSASHEVFLVLIRLFTLEASSSYFRLPLQIRRGHVGVARNRLAGNQGSLSGPIIRVIRSPHHLRTYQIRIMSTPKTEVFNHTALISATTKPKDGDPDALRRAIEAFAGQRRINLYYACVPLTSA
jgi:hypothetical protein